MTTSSEFSTCGARSQAPIFEARLADASMMNKILHELHNIDDSAVLVIEKDNLCLVTAGDKTSQITASFSASTFEKFSYNSDQESLNFGVVLKDFIENLNLLPDDVSIEDSDRRNHNHNIVMIDDSRNQFDSSKTTLVLRYMKRGRPLMFELNNGTNLSVSGEFQAFRKPSDQAFKPITFSEGEEVAEIEFDSRKLYEYISGIDLQQSDYVELQLVSGETPVKLATRSTLLGDVELEIPSCEKEIIRRDYFVSNSLFNYSYRTQAIKRALEALKTSSTMKMRCGSSGLLCLEHFHGVTSLTYTLAASVKQARDYALNEF